MKPPPCVCVCTLLSHKTYTLWCNPKGSKCIRILALYVHFVTCLVFKIAALKYISPSKFCIYISFPLYKLYQVHQCLLILLNVLCSLWNFYVCCQVFMVVFVELMVICGFLRCIVLVSDSSHWIVTSPVPSPTFCGSCWPKFPPTFLHK
jgi:hypothetical protein